MAEVERLRIKSELIPGAKGEWVRYSDYQALLSALREEVGRLQEYPPFEGSFKGGIDIAADRLQAILDSHSEGSELSSAERSGIWLRRN